LNHRERREHREGRSIECWVLSIEEKREESHAKTQREGKGERRKRGEWERGRGARIA
jgi:hypothetical protein